MKREVLTRLQAARTAKQPTALVTDLTGGAQALVVADAPSGSLALTDAQLTAVKTAIAEDKSAVMDAGLTGAGQRLFVQVFSPPLRLIVVGAVHIAQSLIPMARLAGYGVALIDPRRAWASDGRFPGIDLCHAWPDEALATLALDRRCAVVALTHDPKLDDPALDAALRSDCYYIGALGSRRSHAARLARLKDLGHDDAALTRIHGPIGLDIGAKSPAEIAVAILAETIAVRRDAAAAA